LDPINGTEKKWEIKDANGNRNSINNNVLIYFSSKFERVTICSSSHAFIKKQKWYWQRTKNKVGEHERKINCSCRSRFFNHALHTFM
jgi:hypothetical protein